MAVSVNHAPEVTGLQLSLADTLTRIDAALDQADQRAFRMWAKRWASLTARLATLLVKIATAQH